MAQQVMYILYCFFLASQLTIVSLDIDVIMSLDIDSKLTSHYRDETILIYILQYLILQYITIHLREDIDILHTEMHYDICDMCCLQSCMYHCKNNWTSYNLEYVYTDNNTAYFLTYMFLLIVTKN